LLEKALFFLLEPTFLEQSLLRTNFVGTAIVLLQRFHQKKVLMQQSLEYAGTFALKHFMCVDTHVLIIYY
jgi:hypothetical protein